MSIKKFCITLIILLLSAGAARSQEKRTEIQIDFRVNSTTIDSTFSENAARMRQMVELLQEMKQDSTINILEVSFCGAASPEGSYQLNRRLAQGRLQALETFIRQRVEIPDSLITRNDSYIPWEYLKAQIRVSDLERKEEVISILEGESRLVKYFRPNTQVDSRLVELKALSGGRVWRQMHKLFFADMRNACAVLVTYKKELPPTPVVVPDSVVVVAEDVVEDSIGVAADSLVVTDLTMDSLASAAESFASVEGWSRKLHLKSNLIGWGMAMANAAVEVDVKEHWSVTLPVYFSGWNYFKSTIKLRTFALQPEVRYWLSESNDGLFGGAHFGVAYYNLAFDDEYRYQDHNRETPALGGGVSIGYRLPISKDSRWRMEFALGAGVYSLHYDKFYNTPRTKDGLMVGSDKRTFFGIDRAAVSFSYSFDLQKKGGKR